MESDVMDMPLVSFCITSYNQRDYLRQAVESAVNQNYPNLEIIVSDDASTDGSCELLRTYASYCRRPVKVIENKQNVGPALNYERCFLAAHGELLVVAGGDDMSEPGRVTRIVEEWTRTGRRSAVIIHDGIKIDSRGRKIGYVGRRSIESPLGACMAFSSRVVTEFPRISVEGTYEDFIMGRRGILIGDVSIISDKLVRYRVGSGLSSVLRSRREPEMRASKARDAGYLQNLIDFEYAYEKGMIGQERYERLRRQYVNAMSDNKAFMRLVGGETFRERLSAYRQRYRRVGMDALLRLPYLMPKPAGDFIYWCYDGAKTGIKRLQYCMNRS